MKTSELNRNEFVLIEIIRSFDFLIEEYYNINEISMHTIEYPSLIFEAKKRYNRIVYIRGGIDNKYSVSIQRIRWYDTFVFNLKKNKVSWIFDISDYYHFFDNDLIQGKAYPLNVQANFIQKHLMPVIKGEMWIDELIEYNKNKK